MKTKPTFDELMLALDLPLKEFKKRFLLKVLTKLGLLIGAVFLILIVFYISLLGAGNVIVPSIFAIVLGVVLFFILKKKSSDLENLYTDTIVSPMIERLVEDGSYDSEKTMPENIAQVNTQLKYYVDYSSTHYIEGKTGKAYFVLSAIETKDAHSVDNEIEEIPMFSGLLFIAPIKTSFETRIIVKPSRGRWMKKKKNRISIGDPAFEKKFAIVAYDETAARNILTPELKNILLTLPWNIDGKVMIEVYKLFFMVTIQKRNTFFTIPKPIWMLKRALQLDYTVLTFFNAIAGYLDNNPCLWVEPEGGIDE